MILKISDLRDPEQMRHIANLAPTYMGFDFRASSPRYMGEVDAALLGGIPFGIRKVGTFEGEHPLIIVSMAGRYGLNAVQIEGHTQPHKLEKLSGEGLEVIKVITDELLENAAQYDGVCNKLIFRLSTPEKIYDYAGRTPFLVETTDPNYKCKHKYFAGIDSGPFLEKSYGCKDLEILEKYMLIVKQR